MKIKINMNVVYYNRYSNDLTLDILYCYLMYDACINNP